MTTSKDGYKRCKDEKSRSNSCLQQRPGWKGYNHQHLSIIGHIRLIIIFDWLQKETEKNLEWKFPLSKWNFPLDNPYYHNLLAYSIRHQAVENGG